MRINVSYMVIFICICVAMTSQGIVFSANTEEEPDPDGLYGTRGEPKELVEKRLVPLTHEELVALTHEELVARVEFLEKRNARLRAILEIIKVGPEKTSVFSTCLQACTFIILGISFALIGVLYRRRRQRKT